MAVAICNLCFALRLGGATTELMQLKLVGLHYFHLGGAAADLLQLLVGLYFS